MKIPISYLQFLGWIRRPDTDLAAIVENPARATRPQTAASSTTDTASHIADGTTGLYVAYNVKLRCWIGRPHANIASVIDVDDRRIRTVFQVEQLRRLSRRHKRHEQDGYKEQSDG